MLLTGSAVLVARAWLSGRTVSQMVRAHDQSSNSKPLASAEAMSFRI